MRPLNLALLVGLFICTSSANCQDLAAKVADLKPGQSAEEVARILNNLKPERISRQIIYRRHIEQWYYDNGNVRLEFDCRPGQEPRLQSVNHINKQ